MGKKNSLFAPKNKIPRQWPGDLEVVRFFKSLLSFCFSLAYSFFYCSMRLFLDGWFFLCDYLFLFYCHRKK